MWSDPSKISPRGIEGPPDRVVENRRYEETQRVAWGTLALLDGR